MYGFEVQALYIFPAYPSLAISVGSQHFFICFVERLNSLISLLPFIKQSSLFVCESSCGINQQVLLKLLMRTLSTKSLDFITVNTEYLNKNLLWSGLANKLKLRCPLFMPWNIGRHSLPSLISFQCR